MKASTDPEIQPLYGTRLVYSNPWFPYEGYFRQPARCDLKIYQDNSPLRVHVVVIATERAKNPGTSVTNAIEKIATAAEKEISERILGEAAEVDFIEHYTSGPHRPFPETFHLVRFRTLSLQGGYAEPQWFHLDREHVERILGMQHVDIDA